MRRKRSSLTVYLAMLLSVVCVLSFGRVFFTQTNAMAVAFAQDTQKTPQPDTDTEQVFVESLESLNDLNRIAVDAEVVFIFVPGPENSIADDTTNASASAAQMSLKNNNINVRLYILPSESPDYSVIASQVEIPAILVAVKGGGIVVVPCEKISEEMLLQAFLACCDSGSGCCP